MKTFITEFMSEFVVSKGIQTVLNLKAQVPGSYLDFYSSQERAEKNLNPYVLRLAVNHLVKTNSPILTQTPETVSTLIYLLAFMSLYFQDQKGLVIKLQKTLIKLIVYVRRNSASFKD